VSHPPANQPFPGPAESPDRAGPSHSPRSGAHRPRRPLWHDILPAVVVLVAVAALVFGIFQLKDSVLGSAGTSNNGPVDSGPQEPQPSAPTAPVSTTAKPSASRTPTKPATASTPTINRAVKVKVYNSTSRTGLAKGAASKLSAASWNADSAGNQHGFSGSTTVYYTKASLRLTAKAIAKDLGGYPVRESTAYGSTGVIVILASDYSS
jgi:hypothetical protein